MGLGIALILHAIAAAVWVGGMFFAYLALRPAAAFLESPLRLTLWVNVFDRFFPWVIASIALLLLTGYWMVFSYYGGMAGAGLHIHAMQGTGLLMMLLFAHLYFAPFKRLKRAAAVELWQEATPQLKQIRLLILINLLLGLITIALGAGGQYLLPYLGALGAGGS